MTYVMFTAFFCPILCTLSSACIKRAGVQYSSANTTRSAAVRVIPCPPAVIDSKATRQLEVEQDREKQHRTTRNTSMIDNANTDLKQLWQNKERSLLWEWFLAILSWLIASQHDSWKWRMRNTKLKMKCSKDNAKQRQEAKLMKTKENRWSKCDSLASAVMARKQTGQGRRTDTTTGHPQITHDKAEKQQMHAKCTPWQNAEADNEKVRPSVRESITEKHRIQTKRTCVRMSNAHSMVWSS